MAQDFEQFVADHGDRLLHAAFALCGDWQQAEDLVQQALLTLARRWTSVDAPLAYAYRCLARANIDRWRLLRNRVELAAEPATVAALTAPAGSAEAGVDRQLAIVAALRTLPPRQRAIVVLRYLHDLSEADTAAVLGIGVGAVKSGASRGLARLRAAAELEEDR